jgi:hypothetical protein
MVLLKTATLLPYWLFGWLALPSISCQESVTTFAGYRSVFHSLLFVTNRPLEYFRRFKKEPVKPVPYHFS